jgi:hypothetical protein
MQATFAQYGSATTVTTSDTTPVTCRAIYVGGAGNVAVKTSPTATAVTFTAPPVGSVLPLMIDGGYIMATNTTATLLVALN